MLYTHMGAKKKLVARILKSETLILKYKAHIFRTLKTRLKLARKTRTKTTVLSQIMFA